MSLETQVPAEPGVPIVAMHVLRVTTTGWYAGLSWAWRWRYGEF